MTETSFELLLSILFPPVCATITGFTIWGLNRGQEPTDTALFRDFLIILFIVMLTIFAISRAQPVRVLIDPQFRIQTELENNSFYADLKRLSSDDHNKLHTFLLSQMEQGDNVTDALLKARPLLTRLGTYKMGFADQQNKVAWAKITISTLNELLESDPMNCYREMAQQPLSPETLTHAFSPDNTQAFQYVVIGIYESNKYENRNKRSPTDQAYDRNEVWHEYRLIKKTVAAEYGQMFADIVTKRRFPATPTEDPERICEARIFQLEAILERPQGIAASLVLNALR